MATINLPTRMSLPIPESIMVSDRLAASKYLSDFGFQSEVPRRKCVRKQIFAVRSMSITEQGQRGRLTSPNGALGAVSFAFFLFLYLGFRSVVDFWWCSMFGCWGSVGKGKNWNFELWVFFFRFLVIGGTKALDACFIELFCSVWLLGKCGKAFESWAFDFALFCYRESVGNTEKES
ncbi:hypothetical protein SLA2020_451370 [Shorea laevis]